MDKILKNIKQNGIENLEVFEDKGGGRTGKSREIIDKFKCNPVPILEREYWSFVK